MEDQAKQDNKIGKLMVSTKVIRMLSFIVEYEGEVSPSHIKEVRKTILILGLIVIIILALMLL